MRFPVYVKNQVPLSIARVDDKYLTYPAGDMKERPESGDSEGLTSVYSKTNQDWELVPDYHGELKQASLLMSQEDQGYHILYV